MQHLNFSIFRDAINAKFLSLANNKDLLLLRTNVPSDVLYNEYLISYPQEVNGIFRERQHYDGNYDKNYIKRLGNLIAIDKDGNKDTIWNTPVEGYFNNVAQHLHNIVLNSEISGFYFTTEKLAGSLENKDNINPDITWTHFYSVVPKQFVRADCVEYVGNLNMQRQMLKRGLTELTLDSFKLVKELIDENLLYRGTEHLTSLTSFMEVMEEYEQATDKESFIWFKSFQLGALCRFKNSVIGTLISDLSSNIPLEDAVKMFTSKVAPENYKRTTALITPRMVEEAKETLAQENLLDSLQRRYANKSDLNVNDYLFKGVVEKSLDIFDDLKKESSQKLTKRALNTALDKVVDISVEEFILNILPQTKQVEVLFKNQLESNLMSLITETNVGSEQLFKWNNPFSWSYKGGIADSSLRAKVASLGGRVDGALRFSHTWNYDKQRPNQSLMDLHVFMPGFKESKDISKEIHNSYPNTRRVGWNNRSDSSSGASQDVDFVNAPGDAVPVENIVFPTLEKMPEGVYTFKIHCWSERHPNKSGFKAEIEFAGQLYEYEHIEPLKNHQWITLAEVTLKDGEFTIEHKHPTTTSSKEVWGITTESFVTVDTITLSPNYWGDNKVGNEHLFFFLEGCKNPEQSRGFYNEFLRSDLEKHRKVFEVLAEKTKTELADEQLSGLGFSLTKRDSVIVRVSGKTKQIFKINF